MSVALAAAQVAEKVGEIAVEKAAKVVLTQTAKEFKGWDYKKQGQALIIFGTLVVVVGIVAVVIYNDLPGFWPKAAA